MSVKNIISTQLSAEAIERINANIADISKNLPFLINLSDEAKQALPQMGDKTLAFVEKAFDYARQKPDLLPPFLSVEEFGKDLELVKQLNALLRNLEPLIKDIESTRQLAGSEAYQAALLFYNAVKLGKRMNILGTEGIADDLQQRFPRGARTDIKNSPAQDA